MQKEGIDKSQLIKNTGRFLSSFYNLYFFSLIQGIAARPKHLQKHDSRKLSGIWNSYLTSENDSIKYAAQKYIKRPSCALDISLLDPA